MFIIIMTQILKMLLLLGTGILCFRTGLVDQKGNRSLSNILLNVVSPALAISSLQIEYRTDLIQGLAATYAMAAFTHVLFITLATLLIRKKDNPHFDLERFTVIYSNCGFIGIPLVQSVLGAEGVFYLTAYITVFNLFSWTHGILLMSGKSSPKEAVKGLLTPMIVACILGLVLFLMQVRLPAVLGDSLSYLASMNTPLAMLIAGVSVAQTDLVRMLKNVRVYMVSLIRLVLLPLFVLVVLVFLPVPYTAKMVVMIVSACPTATSGTAFSLQFGKDYRYASELYTFTTVACLLTIPLFVTAGDYLFR